MTANEISIIKKQQPEIPFTQIRGEDLGGAKIRFTMKWGPYDLKRITWTPYGITSYKPAWTINEQLLMSWNGDLEIFLEEKFQKETAQLQIIITK